MKGNIILISYGKNFNVVAVNGLFFKIFTAFNHYIHKIPNFFPSLKQIQKEFLFILNFKPDHVIHKLWTRYLCHTFSSVHYLWSNNIYSSLIGFQNQMKHGEPYSGYGNYTNIEQVAPTSRIPSMSPAPAVMAKVVEPPPPKPPLPEEHMYLQTVFEELRNRCTCAANNPVCISFSKWCFSIF